MVGLNVASGSEECDLARNAVMTTSHSTFRDRCGVASLLRKDSNDNLYKAAHI